MRILAAVSFLAIGAAGCASSPKYRAIENGHVLVRLSAHADNLSDILSGAKDAAGAVKAMKAYCDPRAEDIADFNLQAISDSESPAIENLTAFQAAFERLQKVMLVQPAWFADESFKNQILACLPMAGSNEGDSEEGEGPQSDILFSAWDFVTAAECDDFAHAFGTCYEDLPEESRSAMMEAFETLGESVVELELDEEHGTGPQATRCAELAAVAKSTPPCPAIFAVIEAARANDTE